MSQPKPSAVQGTGQNRARLFAALGDETRLMLVRMLCDGQQHSISQLSQAQPATTSKLTRQAITKHLRVLERARLVHGVRRGRESLYELDPRPIERLKEYLDLVSEDWDRALGRLKAMVEND